MCESNLIDGDSKRQSRAYEILKSNTDPRIFTFSTPYCKKSKAQHGSFNEARKFLETFSEKERKKCCKIHHQKKKTIGGGGFHGFSREASGLTAILACGSSPRGAARNAWSTYSCRLPFRCTVLPASVAGAAACRLVQGLHPGTSHCLRLSPPLLFLSALLSKTQTTWIALQGPAHILHLPV